MKTILKGNISARVAVYVYALIMILSVSCDDDNGDVIEVKRRTTTELTGAKEVPPVATTGRGTANITYNTMANTIEYTITWELGNANDNTVGMHFHGAENGSDTTSSPIVIAIPDHSTSSSGTISGTTRELTDAEENQLLDGKWYVNIHSTTYPNGEMRGNIKF